MQVELAGSSVSVLNQLDFFINILGVFSSILLGVFAVLAVILGFLVWKHEEMRKRAQEELKKIEELSTKITAMYADLGVLVETAQGELTRMESWSNSLGKLLESAEGNSQRIAETRDEVNKIKSEIKVSASSLATISRFIPSISPVPPSSSVEFDKDLMMRAMKKRLVELQGVSAGNNN